MRSEGKKGAFGNQVSVMVVPLPTHEPDLRKRLTAMQGAMSFAKERHRAMPATLMQDFAEFIPPAIAARATRVITGITAAGRFSPLFNVVISNVPGPQFPLYSAGARMLGNYPVSAITDGVGLNMTVMSYDGKLDFGLVACREMVPDIWALLDHLSESLGEMMELAAAETAPKKRREARGGEVHERQAEGGAAGQGRKARRRQVAPGSVGQADAPVEARRGVDVEHPHGRRAVVAKAVLHARRDQHVGAGAGQRRLLAEQERQLALEDVEGVVLVVVGVLGELAAGREVDDPEREARRVGGAREELDVADAAALAGRDDDRAIAHRSILPASPGGTGWPAR